MAELAKANIVSEPTFAEKVALSELVVLGTVTEVDRGNRGGVGATATLVVLHTLKGPSATRIVVGTYHPAAELDPHCCELGATYLMFLRPSVRDGRMISVWGRYGMVRIGAPRGSP
jgi:hypothetical protein